MADQHACDVWVVGDDAFSRKALVEVLDQSATTRCTLATDACEVALETVAQGQLPQLVLMDLELDGTSSVEGIGQLKAASPAVRVIVLSDAADHEHLLGALRAGASGFLLKPVPADVLADAVETVMAGGCPVDPFIARELLATVAARARPRREYGLTVREREVLGLLSQARTQREIASALTISPHTVDTHLRNIYRKLRVHSNTGAVAKALRERLL